MQHGMDLICGAVPVSCIICILPLCIYSLDLGFRAPDTHVLKSILHCREQRARRIQLRMHHLCDPIRRQDPGGKQKRRNRLQRQAVATLKQMSTKRKMAMGKKRRMGQLSTRQTR